MKRKVLRDSILHHFALSSVSKKKKQLRGAGLSIVPCWHILDSGFSFVVLRSGLMSFLVESCG